ncbi:MAG: glutamine-hydrolyzing carbamoyl-phosphate synthase small subunit [Actinobacteria bacterium]|nr:MAG: glutamine-hydrolyzing carbamoyl-phosphate synthase small subunit [Actinomycetota bacterium]
MKKKNCILVLEDGRYFEGTSFGASGEIFGEVVFNTSMTGYQEILTDPSYHEQIVTMTYSHIGNYGVNEEDVESKKVRVSGFVVKEASEYKSNWRSTKLIQKYLEENGVVGIQDIDTRALVKHIRLAGAMRGAISTKEQNPKELVKRIKEWPSIIGRDLVAKVSIGKKQKDNIKADYRVAVYDFGIKNNILNCLREAGCGLTIFPASTSYNEILNENFDGLFLSNGPGDPAALNYAIDNVKNLLGKLPIFGICLGHQILSLAQGAETYKLKFGHRGANQPVKNLKTGRVEITSQNHGFAVNTKKGWKLLDDKTKNGDGVFVTHMNLNDQTVEGISAPSIKAFSVQYHPESSPGPHDSRYLFKQFKDLMAGKDAQT